MSEYVKLVSEWVGECETRRETEIKLLRRPHGGHVDVRNDDAAGSHRHQVPEPRVAPEDVKQAHVKRREPGRASDCETTISTWKNMDVDTTCRGH